MLASLLCSTGLEHIAERQPFGTTRDIALDVTRPLHSVSHSLYLDRPEQWLETLAGRRDQPVAPVLLPTATTAAPPTGTATGPAGPTASTGPAGPAVDGVTSTTVFAAPAHRTPTADAPLKVLMAGDSLIGNISQAVARQYGNDPRISLRTDLQVGTGLARPDVLDWGAELSTVLDADPADVVILSFGANDDQPLRDPQGHFLSLFSDGWAKEYARRVSAIMDLASGGGRRTVIWIGLPPERPDRLNEAKDTFNAAASSQAALRTDVHYVDLVPVSVGRARPTATR